MVAPVEVTPLPLQLPHSSNTPYAAPCRNGGDAVHTQAQRFTPPMAST